MTITKSIAHIGHKMFRNNYDNDCVTYSPTGRLFQVEYALEAIKQGSATVGLVSKNHVVLAALKRNAEELGSYQKKIIMVDDHMGISLAGLAPDGRVLSNYLRKQAMSSKMIFNRPLPITKATLSLADKAQENTQSYGSRPYGVGLLVSGYDETGAHLYEFQPSGSVLEYYGAAIGARSQAARTYLERNLDSIRNTENMEESIVHCLNALRDTLPQDVELNNRNTSVSVVGKNQKFTMYEDENIQQWLDRLDSVSNVRDREGPGEGASENQDSTSQGQGSSNPNESGGANSSQDRMDTD